MWPRLLNLVCKASHVPTLHTLSSLPPLSSCSYPCPSLIWIQPSGYIRSLAVSTFECTFPPLRLCSHCALEPKYLPQPLFFHTLSTFPIYAIFTNLLLIYLFLKDFFYDYLSASDLSCSMRDLSLGSTYSLIVTFRLSSCDAWDFSSCSAWI